MQVVITGVRSRTHLVHLAAYLRELGGEPPVTYVAGGTFLGAARVSESDIQTLLRVPLRIVDSVSALGDLPADPITYLSVGAPGIKPWLVMRRAMPRRPINVVVTDEGIGTYGDWRTHRAAWRRQGGGEPWTTTRALAGSAATHGLTTTRFAMYDVRRRFALNPQIEAEFTGQVGDVRPDPTGERVVFLGSPWVELGVLPEASYIAHVRDVARLVERRGKRLVIRPHPVENPSKYSEFEVLATDLPAELDPEVVGAAGAAGGTSTALLNLAALYGMPATRVFTPGLEHLEKGLGATQRRLLDRYLPAAVTAAG